MEILDAIIPPIEDPTPPIGDPPPPYQIPQPEMNSDESLEIQDSEGSDATFRPEDDEDDEEEEIMPEEYLWEEKTKFFYGFWSPRWLMNFNEASGARNLPEYDEIFTPFDAFSLFMDYEAIKMIADNTNIYAQRALEHLRREDRLPAYLQNWIPVEETEIMCLIGICLYMGIVQLPHIKDYWSKDSFFPPHFISKAMSRDRFYLIMEPPHISDINDGGPADKLTKIRPLFTHPLCNWRKFYYPYRQVTIDGGMIKFNGRLKFKQYVKGKANPFGIKTYILADATNGYAWNMIIYTGRQNPPYKIQLIALYSTLLMGYLLKGTNYT